MILFGLIAFAANIKRSLSIKSLGLKQKKEAEKIIKDNPVPVFGLMTPEQLERFDKGLAYKYTKEHHENKK